MLRMMWLTLALSTASLGACHHDPKPMAPKDGELPPLPPASGTPIGYLLDNAAQLKLDGDQREKLQALDTSLSARNDAIETQLREIEKPEEEQEAPYKKGDPPRKPKNMAPGAQQVHTTQDSSKLHAAKNANNEDALKKAFALLDPAQQTAARKLLDDRGITSPGGSAQPPPRNEDNGGVPLEP
jgi:hypothetical protein